MGAGSSTKKKSQEKEDSFDPAPHGTVERLSRIERRRRSSLMMAAANEEGAAGANVDLPAEVKALLPPEIANSKQLGRQYRPTVIVRSSAPSPKPVHAAKSPALADQTDAASGVTTDTVPSCATDTATATISAPAPTSAASVPSPAADAAGAADADADAGAAALTAATSAEPAPTTTSTSASTPSSTAAPPEPAMPPESAGADGDKSDQGAEASQRAEAAPAPVAVERVKRFRIEEEQNTLGFTRCAAKGEEKRRLFYTKVEIGSMMQEWMNEVDEEAGMFAVKTIKLEGNRILYGIKWGDKPRGDVEWVERDVLYNTAPSLLSEYESTHALELYSMNGALKEAIAKAENMNGEGERGGGKGVK